MGIDPYEFISKGTDDFIIRTAMLRKAVEIRSEQRKAELEALAYMISDTFTKLVFGTH